MTNLALLIIKPWRFISPATEIENLPATKTSRGGITEIHYWGELRGWNHETRQIREDTIYKRWLHWYKSYRLAVLNNVGSSSLRCVRNNNIPLPRETDRQTLLHCLCGTVRASSRKCWILIWKYFNTKIIKLARPEHRSNFNWVFYILLLYLTETNWSFFLPRVRHCLY